METKEMRQPSPSCLEIIDKHLNHVLGFTSMINFDYYFDSFV